jgi:2-dehydropantoate 2-reductase
MIASVEDSPQETTHIALLGAGAVGQLICHQLAAKSAKVLLLTRSDSGPQTLTCQPFADDATDSVSNRVSHQFQGMITANLTAEDLAHIRCLIVTTKAYQVVEILTPLLPKLRADCHILLLHNGMGPHLTIRTLLAQYPAMGLSLGTTSQGVIRLSQWQIKHTGTGLTHLGHGFGQPMLASYRQLLLDAIPDSHWQTDIISSLWQKLAINCAINPLTAIHKCKNGALAAPQHQNTIHNLLLELIPVAQAQGVKLEVANLLEKTNQVIHFTANNYSSMYQDIAHSRPTEIDEINGYISQCGKEYGLQTPLHQAIVASIKSLESAG